MDKCDFYIDGTTSIGPDLLEILPQLKATITLMIHTFFCPIAPVEPILRDSVLAMHKLLAEGALEETYILLW